ncbi:MAG: cache domain-containing protein [Desulfobacter sp.]|nr:MAG: cache domain-containing protein [Desulfobacter sp.]
MSLNKKLTIFFVSVFILLSLLMILYSFIHLKQIAEAHIQKDYEERLKIVVIFIKNKHQNLLRTGMENIYEDLYKKDLIRELKASYYKNIKHTYPFILDADSNIIMHPTIPSAGLNRKPSKDEVFIYKYITTHGRGAFEYTWQGIQKWCVFEQFKPWNWYVAFSVDSYVQYDVLNQFILKYSLFVIFSSGIITLLVFRLLKQNVLTPLSLLKDKCKTILRDEATPNLLSLSHQDNEIGELAGSFMDMKKELIRSRNKEMEIARQREKTIDDLQEALAQVKQLQGLLPICSRCKKIRDDSGYWHQVEQYVEKTTGARFSHGMCPECSDHMYGDEEWYIKMKERQAQSKKKD